MSHHSPPPSEVAKTKKPFMSCAYCSKDCLTQDLSEGKCPSCRFIEQHPGEPVPKICKVQGCFRLRAQDTYVCSPCAKRRSQANADHDAEIRDFQLASLQKNKDNINLRTLDLIGAKIPPGVPAAAGSANTQTTSPQLLTTSNTVPQQFLGNWTGSEFLQGQGNLPLLQRNPLQVAGSDLPFLTAGSYTQVPSVGQTLTYGLQGQPLLTQTPLLAAAASGLGTGVLGTQTGLPGTLNLGGPGSAAGFANTGVFGTMVTGSIPLTATGSQTGLPGSGLRQSANLSQSQQLDSSRMPPPPPPPPLIHPPVSPPPRREGTDFRGDTVGDQGGGTSSHISRRDKHMADLLSDRPVLKTGGTRSRAGHRSRAGSEAHSTVSRSQRSYTPPGRNRSRDDEVDPDDSVSMARKRGRSPVRSRAKSPRSSSSGSSTKSTSPPPKRKAFLDMIRGMDKKRKEEEIELHAEPDAMQDMFGSTKTYRKGKPQDEGISLSEHQRHLLESVLHKVNTKKLPPASSRKGIDLSEDTYKHFLRTPKLNPEAADYLSYVNRPQPKKDHNGNVVTPKATAGLKDKLGKEADADFQKIDLSARAGIRQTVYNQWLITSLKKILLVDLSKIDHPLAKEGSELHSIFNELFESSSMQLHDFARSATVCTMARRKIFMNDIKFDQDPHEKALHLPMDTEGEFLFGRQVNKEGESVGFEDIAPDFASKLTALRDARAALKNPNALRLPAGLPKENTPKTSDYKSDNRPGLNRSNKKKKKPRSFEKQKVERKEVRRFSPPPDRSYNRDYDRRDRDQDRGRGKGRGGGSYKQQPFQGKGGWNRKY